MHTDSFLVGLLIYFPFLQWYFVVKWSKIWQLFKCHLAIVKYHFISFINCLPLLTFTFRTTALLLFCFLATNNKKFCFLFSDSTLFYHFFKWQLNATHLWLNLQHFSNVKKAFLMLQFHKQCWHVFLFSKILFKLFCTICCSEMFCICLMANRSVMRWTAIRLNPQETHI